MIWMMSLAFTVWIHVIQTSYAIFNPQLQADITLSIQQVGIAAAVYPCTAALFQLFTGNLMDRFGPRKTIVPAVFCATCGAFLLSRAASFTMVLCSQVILATGACFGFVGTGYITSTWFRKRHFGLIFGLVQVVLSFSVAFGQFVFSYILRIFYWRDVLFCFFCIGIGLSVLAFLFVKAAAEIKHAKFNAKGFVLEILGGSAYVLKQRQVMLCTIHGGVIYGFIWALGVVWLPKIILAHGLTITVANYSVACLWIGVAIGSLFVDRFWRWVGSTRTVLVLFLTIQFVSLFGLLYLNLTDTTAITLSLLFGLGTSSHMLTYTIGKNSVPDQYSGSAISIVNAVMFLVGGFFTMILGAYLETTDLRLSDYQDAVMIFWGGMVIALISSFFFTDKPERSGQEIAPIVTV